MDAKERIYNAEWDKKCRYLVTGVFDYIEDQVQQQTEIEAHKEMGQYLLKNMSIAMTWHAVKFCPLKDMDDFLDHLDVMIEELLDQRIAEERERGALIVGHAGRRKPARRVAVAA